MTHSFRCAGFLLLLGTVSGILACGHDRPPRERSTLPGYARNHLVALATADRPCADCSSSGEQSRRGLILVGNNQLSQCLDLGWFLRQVEVQWGGRNQLAVAAPVADSAQVAWFLRGERIHLPLLGIHDRQLLAEFPPQGLTVILVDQNSAEPTRVFQAAVGDILLAKIESAWGRR